MPAAFIKGLQFSCFDTAPIYSLAEGWDLEWLQPKNDPSIQVAKKKGNIPISWILMSKQSFMK